MLYLPSHSIHYTCIFSENCYQSSKFQDFIPTPHSQSLGGWFFNLHWKPAAPPPPPYRVGGLGLDPVVASISPCRTKVGGRGHREAVEFQRCHNPESSRTETQLQLLIRRLLEIIRQGYSIELPRSLSSICVTPVDGGQLASRPGKAPWLTWIHRSPRPWPHWKYGFISRKRASLYGNCTVGIVICMTV